MFVKIFQVSSDEGMGTLSKFFEFLTQKYFKEEQNILTPYTLT